MPVLYGVDFGTTNSSIALLRHDVITGAPRSAVLPVEPSKSPDSVLRSLVCITQDGHSYVGLDAGEMATLHDGAQLTASVKRLLGRSRDFNGGSRRTGPTDIAALILSTLRERAEAHLLASEEWPHGAVVGVPVHFNDIQKRELLRACVQAGFVKDDAAAETDIHFVSEPVAVALSYGLKLKEDKRVLVFDFGGGTLDLTLIDMVQVRLDALKPHEVLAKDGIRLGGDDIDHLLLKEVIRRSRAEDSLREAGVRSWDRDELAHTQPGWHLLRTVEQAKISLSNYESVPIVFRQSGVDINEQITRDEYRDLLEESVLNRINTLIRRIIQGAGLEQNGVDQVLLAGGSSLIPPVQDLLRRMFGPDKVAVHDNPLTSIAEGLAVAGGLLLEYGNTYEDITDFDYGVWDAATRNVSVIIPSGTPYKDVERRDDHTFGKVRSYSPVQGGQQFINVQVHKVQEGVAKKLREFRIRVDDTRTFDQRFDVYFAIDKRKGIIVVRVYDRHLAQWIEPTENEVAL